MNDDVRRLRLGAIGHYIGAAITALFACFPLIHVSIGLIFLLNPAPAQGGEPFPTQVFGLMFALIGGAFVLCGWAFATRIFAAGQSIAARKSFLSFPLLYFSLAAIQAPTDAPEIVLANHIGVDSNGYGSPVHLVNLENQSIKESSGVAASQRNTNIFWTHNDSGDGPFIYAFDRQGKHRGVWRVAGAKAVDWEDMAIGPGPKRGRSYLYIGDIGDNSKKRDQITVYRVAEPRITPKDSSSTVQNPRETDAADVIRLKYPDGRYDAETLLIHPLTGDLYVITKVRGAAARVYKLRAPAPKSGVSILSYVGELRFPNQFLGFITGGAISPDGHRVIISDYLGACELILPGKRGIAFDEIWKQSPLPVDIGGFPGVRRQGEAICYRADGLALLATSEGLPCPLIEVARKR